MNERIFQLAKQAQIKFEAHLQHLGIDTAVITPADLEKFAELIVQECLRVSYNSADMLKSTNPAYSDGIMSNNLAIREHFGVE